ncbi:hypothetical protein F2P79_003529 [Pimephales promelas]|nr:hypothetical protein F2P79_003529 [Pimephales promelas]
MHPVTPSRLPEDPEVACSNFDNHAVLVLSFDVLIHDQGNEEHRKLLLAEQQLIFLRPPKRKIK